LEAVAVASSKQTAPTSKRKKGSGTVTPIAPAKVKSSTTTSGRAAARAEAPRRSPRPRADLDDADRRIIEMLSHDGRLSNRALAAEIGLTEATVASRIRTMADRHILGITAVLDWQAAGYDWDVWLEVEVEVGVRSLAAIGDELAAMPGVHSVQTVFGPVDLVVHALLADRAQAIEFISDQISTVVGVRRARPNVVLETVKYTVQYARVPVSPIELHLPAPRIDLDQLDHRLIRALVQDGRQSNRAVARDLNVSEGTVRVRLRRLEDAGLLRIVGQSDPYLAGLVNAWAYIWVDVEAGAIRAVSRRLADMTEVTIVAVTAGRHDLLLLVATVSRTRLVELVVQEIRAVSGVRITETWEVAHTARLNYQWARLVKT
jgi:DNA-binding Lrp family transcriptional regulator